MPRCQIIEREKLAPIIAKARKEGEFVGLTNGVFDILHAGHVDFLRDAKSFCHYLVVSINTDESVKKYKDPGRPLVSQEHRAEVIAALSCVDYVTFHNERRMRETLEILRPSYYIKGGDYKPEQLTSRDVVLKYGGDVLILPLMPGISTTEIIDRVLIAYCPVKPSSVDLSAPEPAPAVFLDRDGVINADHGYVSDPDDFELLPGAIEGMKKFQEAGYFLVVVTNQGGIGIGYYSKEDFFRVNLKMFRELSKSGVFVDKIYFCPHTIKDKCNCRKPGPGMLNKARKDLPIIMEKSIMLGDKETDILAGRAAGVKTCFISSGKAYPDLKESPDLIAGSILEAAKKIID
jgi:D-glycero-D-manno-heptose 1,7-bisphosphate phosphatase